MVQPNQRKSLLRDAVRRRVLALPADARQGYDRSVCCHILGCVQYQHARQVLAYLAMADEVCLQAVFERCVSDRKRVYLPVLGPAPGQILFRSWNLGEELGRRVRGPWEPLAGELPRGDLSLSLVPGRAFDKDGNRLGRGLGCYDRCMPTLEALGPTLGVAYNCQIVPRVPHSGHDKPVSLVVTERGFFGGTAVLAPGGQL